MAITKIIGAIHPPSKGSRHKVLGNTIDYILDEEKTENGRLVGSIACFPDNALQQMLATQHQYGQDKTNLGKHERLGYHLTISFSPEEVVPPEIALQVMKEFSEELLGGKHEAVYSVHTDKEHIHGHLCFNSVNFQTGRKFCYRDGDWAKIIQPITDRVCQKYGLHTLEMDTGKSIEEYEKEEKRQRYLRRMFNREQKLLKKHGYHKDGEKTYNWNEHLRLLLDDIVLHSNSMEDFFGQLKSQGFKVKPGTSDEYGEYIGLKAPGMGIHRKTYQLGQEYTLESLRRRVEMRNKPLPEYQIPENMILIIPVRFYSRIKHKNVLSNEMRRYYARLYRLGIKPRSSRITYQDVKKAREKAERVHRELEFVIGNQIGSKHAAEQQASICRQKVSRLDLAMEAWNEKHSSYEMMLKKYHWYKKKKKQIQKSPIPTTEEERVLKEAKYAFEKYGFSEADVEKYLLEKKEEKKDLMTKRKEAQMELEAAEQVVSDMEELEKEEDLTEEELRFWNSITDYEKMETYMNKEGRKL